MKTFPPLQPLTERKLKTSPCHGAELMAQTLYGAGIDSRLALLLPVAACPPFGGDDNPHWAESFRVFTAAAGAALVSGDISFFSQIVHCLERVQAQNLDMNGLDWLAAYAEVQMGASDKIPPPPLASAVADAKNNHDKKTSIPAVEARDACRKLRLPLAPGARGKKRGGESGKTSA